MEKIRVVIVEDEPIAQEIMAEYTSKVPALQLVGKCKNALEAFSLLSREKVDLLLLDINMPEINGLDFLKTLRNPPLVIFTTAYPEFAVESYEQNAIDYLLKPISFERFLKAINKVTDLIKRDNNKINIQQIENQASFTTKIPDNLIFVKSEGKLVKVDLTELWFVEGLKDYIQLWTGQGRIIVHSTMKNIEEQLATHSNFVRINKSFIINLKYLKEIDGNMVLIKDQKIPVGSTYRETLQQILKNYRFL
jgi:DNA-binding LytR/AlgR family response regulator